MYVCECVYVRVSPPSFTQQLVRTPLPLASHTHSFVFDDEALEIKKAGEDTDNVIVGGRNRWPYESFINWEFWWPAFPVLVYYKVCVSCASYLAFCS